MAKPSEKLAQSLDALRKLQNRQGIAIIRSKDLTRTHRDRLLTGGFIREVIKGWYISTEPGEGQGESTSWFTSFWNFIAAYCGERFGKEWCLSPEQSLAFHTGNYAVPSQLLVRSPRAQNNKIDLLHRISLFDVTASIPAGRDLVEIDGINLFSLSAALVSCSPGYFSKNTADSTAALLMIGDASEILSALLAGGHNRAAGRLAGAFRYIGRDRIADEIVKTMKSAGYSIRESNPFNDTIPKLPAIHHTSPHANRIMLLWRDMRQNVIDSFPTAPGLPEKTRYLREIDEIYTTDAYHSLSIEGYRVTAELIEKVKRGSWNPEGDDMDRELRNALAARGYWQAFQSVKVSLQAILKGKNPGMVAHDDHASWYRELFAPVVTAGIVKASDLAGYRNDQVFIKGSRHIPPRPEAVRHAMPALFDMLKEESKACVRAVLGHFIFAYIHPYMDGNGRMGRFLMNAMLVSGGYPWTVIPIEKRTEYMTALEKASLRRDILPFARFIAGLLSPRT